MESSKGVGGGGGGGGHKLRWPGSLKHYLTNTARTMPGVLPVPSAN